MLESLLLLHHEHDVPQVNSLRPRPDRECRGAHHRVASPCLAKLPLLGSADCLQSSPVGFLVPEI